MKSSLTIFRLAAALVATATSLPARNPFHLVDFTPVGEWPAAMPDATVTVRGHCAFVAQWHPDTGSSLRLFDVSDPAHPVIAGEVPLPPNHYPEEILVAGQHAYVRFYGGGFHVIDVRDPAHPVLTGSYFSNDGNITAIAIHGSYVCVGAYRVDGGPGGGALEEFRVIDVSNPANPVAVGECPLADGGPIGIAISKNRAYLAHYDSLVVVNLDHPLKPEVIGRYDFPPTPASVVGATPVGVVVAGNHAVVATRSGPRFFWAQAPDLAGLEVIDISDPARPAPAGRYLARDGFSGVTMADGYVVAFTPSIDMGSGVLVFDVRDAGQPRRVDRGNLRTAFSSMAVANNHLFVPGSGIYRIEKPSPASPLMDLRLNPVTAAPELTINSLGYDDFALMTSTSLTEWQPWGTVFSRLPEFKLMPEGSKPAKEARRFYRTAEAVSPEEMTLQWEAVRPDNYRFRFERIESAGLAVFTAIVEVNRWHRIVRIDDARLNGKPLGNAFDYRFTTPDDLFWTLQRTRCSTDLVIVKQDATLHYPTWVYIDPNAQTAGDEVTIRMTDLEEVGVAVAPPDRPMECKCLPPP